MTLPHCKLIFDIDDDAPREFTEAWLELKKCFNSLFVGEHGTYEFGYGMFLKFCNIESNKNLPPLTRSEGGIGGCNNVLCKQLRFCDIDFRSNYRNCAKNNTALIFDILNPLGTEGPDKFKVENDWTLIEIEDLVQAFIKMCDEKEVNSNGLTCHLNCCIKGYIKIAMNMDS